MTDREREKQLLDRFAAQRDADLVRSFIELLEIRLTRHKDSLLVTEDGNTRGRGLECRELLRYIKGNGDV